MKPTFVIISFLMIFLWHDVSSANGTQVAWRWRNDDGNVYTATWKDSVNTPVVLTQYENIRLRIEDLVDSRNSSRISLRYTEDPFAETWIPITGVDTGKFFISPSRYLTDAMSYFDNQCLPPFNPDNVYRRTITVDSSISHLLVAEESSIYEFEYSIKPTLDIQPGSAYFFCCFMDSTVMGPYFSADWEGAVLLTPPVSWKSQSIGRRCFLYGLSFVDTNHGTAVGYGSSAGVIFRTTDGGKTWVNQSSPTYQPLSSVDFADAHVGIAVGYAGTILRTTDGGQNWLVLSSLGSGIVLQCISFSDETNGTIVGFHDTGGGIILRTTNGGENWFQQQYPTNRRLYSVCFTSSDVGTVVGEAGIVLRTTNGGQDWSSGWSGTYSDLRGVCFTDANNGTVVGGGSGPNEGLILRTTDGGSTWGISAVRGAPGLCAVYFADKSIGWTAGYGGWILKTTDGGLSWKKLTSGTYRSLYAVHFVDSETGWVVGEGGRVLTTTNGGATSVDHKQGDGVPREFVLLQNYPNPFNPSTTINYDLPRTSHVKLTVYDMLGRELATLVEGVEEPGYKSVQWNGSDVSSGVYFYRLQAGSFVETKKMLLLH